MGNKFHQENIVLEARALKKQGISAAEIARRLHVSDTTVLRWCNDIPSANSYHRYAQNLRDKARAKSVESLKNIKITREKAKILVGILYWCEGAKYPASNFVAFSNSDIDLVVSFMKLFRLAFQPKENKLKASLQLHSTHNEKEMISFWSKTLKIPKLQFYKSTITKPTKNMKRKDYKGTCTVRYYDAYLLLEIMGVFEEFSRKMKNDGGVA